MIQPVQRIPRYVLIIKVCTKLQVSHFRAYLEYEVSIHKGKMHVFKCPF